MFLLIPLRSLSSRPWITWKWQTPRIPGAQQSLAVKAISGVRRGGSKLREDRPSSCTDWSHSKGDLPSTAHSSAAVYLLVRLLVFAHFERVKNDYLRRPLWKNRNCGSRCSMQGAQTIRQRLTENFIPPRDKLPEKDAPLMSLQPTGTHQPTGPCNQQLRGQICHGLVSSRDGVVNSGNPGRLLGQRWSHFDPSPVECS